MAPTALEVITNEESTQIALGPGALGSLVEPIALEVVSMKWGAPIAQEVVSMEFGALAVPIALEVVLM